MLSDIKFSCMVNVFLFQVKAYRCGAFFFIFFDRGQKRRRALNFRLNFLTKKCRGSVWFLTYLMQNVFFKL